MSDAVQVIVEFLRAPGNPFADAVGDRVYGYEVPAGFDNTQKAVRVEPLTEAVEPAEAVMGGRYLFKCMGGDSLVTSARSVAMLLLDRLHGATEAVASGELKYSRCLSMAPGIRDKETGWPCYLATYQILTE